ncbi:MAG: formylglycine-generating enzyme family protein [Acidobacteria bacterium]|nr:formylglycine-generating enzyme family protein [Acidobacteriota bacterium]
MADDDTYVFGSDASSLSELEFWKAANGSGRVEELQAFIAAFPASPFAGLARLRIARAGAESVPVAPACTPVPSDPAPAERSRFLTLDATGTTTTECEIEASVDRLTLGGGVTIDVIRLPGGVFRMGATNIEAMAARRELSHAAAGTALRWIQEEQPRREVTVSPFAIGRTPVTQRQWREVAALPQCSFSLDPEPSEFRGDDNPVERVSWIEAREFCDRLAALTGRTVRLPSEAEWEYACRGGTEAPFAFGETLTPEVANYHCSEKFAGGPRAEPIGRPTGVGCYGVANPFGLVDMHGNVWEWCRDWHARDTYSTSVVVDPWGACSGTARVRRGGSWRTPPVFCRSAARFSAPPQYRHSDTGFRIVIAA